MAQFYENRSLYNAKKWQDGSVISKSPHVWQRDGKRLHKGAMKRKWPARWELCAMQNILSVISLSSHENVVNNLIYI